MPARVRKLVALVLLVAGLTVYALAAAAIGALLPHLWYLQLPFYLVAGIAWALPLKPLFRWANSEPTRRPGPDNDS